LRQSFCRRRGVSLPLVLFSLGLLDGAGYSAASGGGRRLLASGFTGFLSFAGLPDFDGLLDATGFSGEAGTGSVVTGAAGLAGLASSIAFPFAGFFSGTGDGTGDTAGASAVFSGFGCGGCSAGVAGSLLILELNFSTSAGGPPAKGGRQHWRALLCVCHGARQAGVKVADDLVHVVLDEAWADDLGVFAEAQDPVGNLG
jgi:hypothetical protein